MTTELPEIEAVMLDTTTNNNNTTLTQIILPALFCCRLAFDMQHTAQIVEAASISRASFDKLVPFYVVEQSSRACLCVYCYKAKLITIGLFDLWSTLHRGETPASPCTCKCSLCDGGGCTDYLPYRTRKHVYSMGSFSDLHMCEKEDLYTSRDGTRVQAHKSTCVTGNCLKCRRKQADFFN